MNKNLLLICLLMLLGASAFGQEYKWEVVEMDGSRSGCISPSKENVAEAVGRFEGNKYIAPDGKVYK